MIAIPREKRCARFLVAIFVNVFFRGGVDLGAQITPPQASPIQYSPQLVAEIKRVQQAAFESDYAYRQLAHLSNNIGPRLSGSPQAQAAVEDVAAELRKLGLEVQLEKVIVPHW